MLQGLFLVFTLSFKCLFSVNAHQRQKHIKNKNKNDCKRWCNFFYSFQGHTAEVLSLCFDTVGSQLVTGSFDHTVAIWDVASKRSHYIIIVVLDPPLAVNSTLNIVKHCASKWMLHHSVFILVVCTLWLVTWEKSVTFSLTGIAPW